MFVPFLAREAPCYVKGTDTIARNKPRPGMNLKCTGPMKNVWSSELHGGRRPSRGPFLPLRLCGTKGVVQKHF